MIVISFLLFVFLICSPLNARQHPFTVVIDAGHGGVDPGAVGKSAKEKDINLATALTLGDNIKKNHPEINVLYTRTKDVFIPLKERSYIVGKDTADLFISIHANFSNNRTASGVETFILGSSKSEENLTVAMRENAVIQLEKDYETTYQGFNPNSPESYIIFELTQNKYMNQSKQFATYIQQQFSSTYHRVDREVKEAGFWVLLKSACPAVLVELGFLSNRDEELFLMSEKGINQSATAIADAFSIYYGKLKYRDEVQPTAQPSGKLYAVQIFTSRTQLPDKHPAFRGLTNCQCFFKDGWYKYYYGATKDKREAKKTKNKLKSELFPDCFLIEL